MLKTLGIAISLAAFSSQAWPVATSLVEATATVAVGKVMSGVAVGGAIDAINDSKVQAAIGDVSAIGRGILAFYKTNAFQPMYRRGDQTGARDLSFAHLVSENGSFPTDITPGKRWGIPARPTAWQQKGLFGHKPGPFHGSFEGQLVRNQPGGDASRPFPYPLRGAYTGNPQRGWAGPYVAMLPKTDPWGNKYMVNIHDFLTARAVFVISAGPNRAIETSSDQQSGTFTVSGDDIVFRVK